MAKKPLKVGFDLDGVILYNPVRVLRPFSAFTSKLLFHKKKTSFYIPRSPIMKFAWYLLHKTSFVPARGLKELKKLVEDNKIEAHLITARYSSLTHDFEKWMKSIHADDIFASHRHNVNNEQPHEFKKNTIEKLGLDVFVEDNWDIVKELRPKVDRPQGDKSTKIFWITNFLDSNITHDYKFHNLRGAINRLKEITT
ncbi:MAG: hypothetical protein WAT72_00240 [Microgenomates group bacterium]|nr:MAG: hypothetical protein IPH70_01015 [Candidatus Roizmanbacteria bacterium]